MFTTTVDVETIAIWDFHTLALPRMTEGLIAKDKCAHRLVGIVSFLYLCQP